MMSSSPYTFDSPDADVILRAPLDPDDPVSTEFKDFYAHKTILSTASPLFNDMFSLPQPPPPPGGHADLPVIPVMDPAEIFETFLRLIYPIEPPSITSLQTVDALSQLSMKYMADCVHSRLKHTLVSPFFLENDPIWVYVIACRMGLEEEAKLAIRHTYQFNILQSISLPILHAMTAEMYNHLLQAHADRRKELISVLKQTKTPSWGGGCHCGPWFFRRLADKINLALWEKPILDGPRLVSCLESYHGKPASECKLGTSCRISADSLTAHFANILDAIEKHDAVTE